jgi:hypothetical protein
MNLPICFMVRTNNFSVRSDHIAMALDSPCFFQRLSTSIFALSNQKFGGLPHCKIGYSLNARFIAIVYRDRDRTMNPKEMICMPRI